MHDHRLLHTAIPWLHPRERFRTIHEIEDVYIALSNSLHRLVQSLPCVNERLQICHFSLGQLAKSFRIATLQWEMDMGMDALRINILLQKRH